MQHPADRRGQPVLPAAMSRHRAVRNLDLTEELADDYDHDADFLGMFRVLTSR